MNSAKAILVATILVDSVSSWSRPVENRRWMFSVNAGLGIFDGQASGALSGAAARRLFPGVFKTISLYGEIELARLFWRSDRSFPFSVHAVWALGPVGGWTPMVLTGLGGAYEARGTQSSWQWFPRVGLGLIRDLSSVWGVRLELSHELTTLGLTARF